MIGARALLGFGAAWSTLSSAVVLALPAVRAVTGSAPGAALRPLMLTGRLMPDRNFNL